jgi:hypothetical protein
MTLSFVLRGQILRFGIETYLNFKTDGEKWKVFYEKIFFENGVIKIKDCKIETKDTSFEVEIDLLDIHIQNRKRFNFDLSLFFHHPVISLKNEFPKALSKKTHSFAPLAKVKIDAEDGQFLFFDKGEEKGFYFSIEASNEARAIGKLFLSDSLDAKKSSQILAKLYAWPEELMSELEFQNAPLSFVDELTKLFDRNDIIKWKFLRGFVNGRLWLSIDRYLNLTQANLNLRFIDLVAVQSDKGLTAEVRNLNFDMKYPKELNVGSFLSNTSLNLDLRCGKINCIDPTYNTDFTVSDIHGNLNFHSFKDSIISLKANLDHKDQSTPILLSVNPSNIEKDTLDVDLKVSETSLSTRLNLSIAKEEKDLLVVRGKIKEMDALEIGMLKHALGFFSKELKEFQIQKGKVTSQISLRIIDGALENVLLDDFVAEDLEILWKEKEIFATTNHLSGRATLNFKNLFCVELPNWEVNIQNGKFIKRGEGAFELDNVGMQLYMVRNVFEPSWIRATYNGMDLLANVLGYYKEADLILHLDTRGDKLLEFLNKNQIEAEKFNNYKVHADLNLTRRLGYWDVKGKSYLNLMEDLEDSISFSFHMSDSIFNQETWNIQNLSFITRGMFETNLISSEFLKFITACNSETWVYEGLLALNGTFSGKSLEANILLANGNFFSDILDIRLNPLSDNSNQIESFATFFMDFQKNDWKLELPLKQALIYEKLRGLNFSETKGCLIVNPKNIELLKCETSLGAIQLAGNLNYKDQSFDLTIDSFSATVAEMEKVLEKFKDIVTIELPFDGLVRNKEGGIALSYNPKDGLETFLHLELVHGVFDVNSLFTVSELSFDFAFHSKEKKARVTNLFGKIPSSYHLGGYFINGREIAFSFDGDKHLEFDLRLENQFLDLARIYATFDFEKKRFSFDKEKTHLFSNNFDEIEISLNDSMLAKDVNLQIDMPLDEINQYFRILCDMKILKEEWGDFIANYETQGKNLHVGLNLENEGLFLKLKTEDLGLSLKKIGKKWEVDEAHFLGINFVGDIEHKDNVLHLRGIKAFTPNSSIEFGDGCYNMEEKIISLPILNAVLELHDINRHLNDARLNLYGKLEIDFSGGLKESFAKAFVNLECEKEGYKIRSLDEWNFVFTFDKGLSLLDSKFAISYDAFEFIFDVSSLSYSIRDQLIQGYKIKTNYGEREINFLSEKTGIDLKEFRKKTEESFIEIDVEYSKDFFMVSGALNDGVYQVKGRDLNLSDLRFYFDKSQMDLSCALKLPDTCIQFHAKVYPDDLGLTIIEGYELSNDERVFYAEAKLFTEYGPSIQKIEGNLFGLQFEFLPMNKMDEWVLLGDVQIDADKLYTHVGPDIKDFIDELKIHKGYELKGEISIKKNALRETFFKGYLKARDFDLAGYVFKTMLSEIFIDRNGVEIKELKISDQGASIQIPKIKLDFSAKGDVFMHIPEVKIDELRPTLLSKRHGKQRLKPFCIKNMVLHDITGNVGDEKSITGKGNLRFINTFKEGNKLADIPIEIISRLGLDIGLLVPVQGELDFSIRGGKIVFTKLKNSFSESRRSYFYLWNKTESFIDFDGNMHIDIRMKQYVLFKITELFILSIQGSVDKPKCYLR